MVKTGNRYNKGIIKCTSFPLHRESYNPDLRLFKGWTRLRGNEVPTLLFGHKYDQKALNQQLGHYSTIHNQDGLLGHYLAGLIESDGTIIVPETERNTQERLLYPVIKITFAEKDAPLGVKIQERVNNRTRGSLEKPPEQACVNLLFQDLGSIKKIALLINGKMRTPKIEALHRLIDYFNGRSEVSRQIPKLGLNTGPLDDNPWLSGYLEADSNFDFRFSIQDGTPRELSNEMRLTQARTYDPNSSYDNNSYLPIMEKIMEFLDVKRVNDIERNRDFIQKRGGREIRKKYTELGYAVRAKKKDSVRILINYLNTYPLFSSKQQDFLAWREFFDIRVARGYRTPEGKARIIKLKGSVNNSRVKFDWTSLKDFYQ